MRDVGAIGSELRKAIFEFILPLQTTRIVDREAFDRLDQSARSLAVVLKGNDLLPRALLNDLHVAGRVIRREAPYIKGESRNLEEMADRLEMTFDLILLGESHEDRTPGVPRIS